MKTTALEATFELQAKAVRLPTPQREHRFHPTRKWRFDFAWPELMLAVEVEGGTRSGGRHVRGNGFQEDCIKYNEAAILGWSVLRGDSEMVNKGELLKMVEEYFNRRAK